MFLRFWILFILTTISNTWLISSGQFSWAQQSDRWIAFILLQLLVTAPLILIEYALTARAKEPLLQGFDRLTRDADASPNWRSLPWSSIIGVCTMGAVLAFHYTIKAAETVISPLSSGELYALLFSSVILMLALSFYRYAAIFLSALMLLVAIVWQFKQHLVSSNILLTYTQFTWNEWVNICIFTFINLFIYIGFYSYTKKNMQTAVKNNLPMPSWANLVFGVVVQILAAILAQGVLVTAKGYTWLWLWLSIVPAVGVLLSEFADQFRHKGYQPRQIFMYLVVTLGLAVAVFYLPVWMSVVWAAMTIIGYCIFTGWKMKISHLRKVLNFKYEWQYNLWRIAVRIGVPLIITTAVVSKLLASF